MVTRSRWASDRRGEVRQGDLSVGGMEFDRQPESVVQFLGSHPRTALNIQARSSSRATAGAYGTRNDAWGGRQTTVQL